MGFTFRVLAVAAIGLICVLASTQVTAVEFNLRHASIEDIDGNASFAITADGITASLTAIVENSNGVLNRTASGFGINAAGTDDTDALDGGDGAESVSMVFNVDVLFQSIAVSGFTTGDQGSIAIGLFTPVSISSSGTHSFASDYFVSAGQPVMLSFVQGNGFSFDSFDVELYEEVAGSSSVPDGGLSAAMLLAGLGLVSVCRRHIGAN